MSLTSTISYKLKSSKQGNTVSFPGKRIKGGQVAILIAERLECESEAVDLFVDGVPLRNDEDVPAYTEVEVVRKNVVRTGRAPPPKPKESAPVQTDASSVLLPSMGLGDEEEMMEEQRRKVGIMAREAGGGRGRGFGGRGRGFGERGGFGGRGGGGFGDAGETRRGPPPPNYICHRCGKGGHYIQDCPERFGEKLINSATGIPSKQLEAVSADDAGPKYAGANGQLFRRVRDVEQLKGMSSTDEWPVGEIPSNLVCPWCPEGMKDAMVMPCCGTVVCQRCVDKVVEDDGICKESGEEFVLDEVEPCEETRQTYAAWISGGSRA